MLRVRNIWTWWYSSTLFNDFKISFQIPVDGNDVAARDLQMMPVGTLACGSLVFIEGNRSTSPRGIFGRLRLNIERLHRSNTRVHEVYYAVYQYIGSGSWWHTRTVVSPWPALADMVVSSLVYEQALRVTGGLTRDKASNMSIKSRKWSTTKLQLTSWAKRSWDIWNSLVNVSATAGVENFSIFEAVIALLSLDMEYLDRSNSSPLRRTVLSV